jgi:CRISPR-associated protein Cas2
MAAAAKTRYVIAYDVEDDGRRAKLARLLLDYGDRVQRSVYEAILTAEELKEVLEEVAKYVSDKDSLRAYPLCAACSEKVVALGWSVETGARAFVIV